MSLLFQNKNKNIINNNKIIKIFQFIELIIGLSPITGEGNLCANSVRADNTKRML